ncbi:hypothetical protein ONZ43_g4025 [Nemania bipapillata]|uniref:Uncharacterized protein n=1 Tax=Nemania bipapillata TaxID=110536 RepID=A0ACC2ITC0_9PEZI|nr:hypothetical protein ONZ43_g4025 [Nemania bipapillata]
MFGLNASIPDAMAGEGMRITGVILEQWRKIDYDIPGKLMPADVADETYPCHAFIDERAVENLDSGLRQLSLEFGLQYRSHHTTSHISTAMPTYQHQHVVYVTNTVQYMSIRLFSKKPILMYLG